MADEKIPKVKTPNLVDLFKKENIRLETVGIRKDRVYNSKKGIEPYAGEFGKVQKMHLLNRALIGFSYKSYQEIKDMTLKHWFTVSLLELVIIRRKNRPHKN